MSIEVESSLSKKAPAVSNELRASVHAKALTVEHQNPSHLHPDPKNARVHTAKQIRQIAKSIETFGFNVPILVDSQNKIIAGHGRLLAAEKLGWSEVPTIQLAHLSEMQIKAFRIADNRLTEISTWNDQLLAEQLLELSTLDLDFDLDVVGFEIPEIDIRIEGLNDGAEDQYPLDDIPDLPKVAVTRLGDLWVLGRHRVLCGSSLDDESYLRLMAGEKANTVFSDPPYNVPIAGHASGCGAVEHRDFAMACGEMNFKEFTGFLTRVLGQFARHSADGSMHFICMDWRHLGEILSAGNAVYSETKNICVWVKNNAGMGSLYRSRHEFVLVFKNGEGPHLNNVQLGQFGRNRTNVWEYDGMTSFGGAAEEKGLLSLHPTVKPVALVADALLDCSARNDIVLDGFLGSGTTLIASERVGRRCFGIEIDPHYVDVAIRRWEKMTGDQAICASTGESFQARSAGVELEG